VVWYDNFLSLLTRREIDKVDVEFLKNNNVVPKGNEYKVVLGLRFLGLTNEDGTATEAIRSLKVVGEEYQKNLEKVVRDAYSLLISKVPPETAKADDVINFFVHDYKMGLSIAKQAARVFVFFARKAGMNVSESLWRVGGISK